MTMGVPSVFVRLGGCNLMCGGMGTQFDKELHNEATWRCDTIEVWMKAQSKPVEEILNEECVNAIKNGAHVVITGGEPMMQQTAVSKFVEYIWNNIDQDAYIEMETNGTIEPTEETLRYIDQFNCSPKLSNSGNDKSMTYNERVITKLNKSHTMFKFVIANEKDWNEVSELYLPLVDKYKVWLMPAGENQELLSQNKRYVAELARDNHLRFSTRLHIEIWNQKTGV